MMRSNVCVLLLGVLAAAFPARGHAQHTGEAPQILEGPQAPGTPPAPPAQPALMNNDTVLRMHKAGLSDDLILETISTQAGRYDTSPDALITLKSAGISDPLLTAMAGKARRSLTNPNPPPVVLSDVNEVGVYYKDVHGNWQPMESEVVHIRSGGFIKSTLTNGIIKQDRNGSVNGREAALLLPRPMEFLIYTHDGVEAGEYELLRFRVNSKNREFRTLTGGVIHSYGGADRDEVAFSPKKVAPHAWTFSLPRDLKPAEYGILPPGSGNITNGGKIYTFAVQE